MSMENAKMFEFTLDGVLGVFGCNVVAESLEQAVRKVKFMFGKAKVLAVTES